MIIFLHTNAALVFVLAFVLVFFARAAALRVNSDRGTKKDKRLNMILDFSLSAHGAAYRCLKYFFMMIKNISLFFKSCEDDKKYKDKKKVA